MRQRYFPVERNHIPAHISLFHALPEHEQQRIVSDIDTAMRTVDPFTVIVEPPRSIGNGVAFFLQAPGLYRIRARLSLQWSMWLTPQDRQSYRPHITVQNKVNRQTLAETLLLLEKSPYPQDALLSSIHLWQYQGGPWKHLQQFML